MLPGMRRMTLGKGGQYRAFASQPPLTIEMPGTPKLQPLKEKPRPKTEMTVLANGLRVVSEDTYSSASSVGLFVEAGSRFETDANSGVSHVLEQMAFKSTQKRSHQRVVRDVEDMGGSVGASSAREYMLYTADVLRSNVDKAIELVAETVMTPKFTAWDLDDQREVIAFEQADMEKNPQALVTEMLYAAAFTDSSPLGRPLFCPARNLHHLSTTDLSEFHAAHYSPNRMILAAAGVDHAELVGLANKYFGTSSKSTTPAPKLPPTKYVGGEQRLRCESPLTHVSLCFNAGGWDSKQLLAMCTLHMLLGGGSSFSSGGPGKGMYSRLYLNLLNKHHWVESAVAFNCMHNDAGVLGIYGTSHANEAGRLVDVIASEFIDVAAKPPSEEETRRAKNALKSSVYMNLETRQVLMEDIGRQVLTYGKREEPEALAARINAVTANDIQQAAKHLLTSPLTFAAFGDLGQVPSYESVAKRFR